MCEFGQKERERRGREKWIVRCIERGGEKKDGYFVKADMWTQIFFSGLFPLLTVPSGFLGNRPPLAPTAKLSRVGQATGWTLVADATQQGRQRLKQRQGGGKKPKHCLRLALKRRSSSLRCCRLLLPKETRGQRDTKEKRKPGKR